MTIHKFFRLCSLTVATLFWASCGTDSNPQFPVAQATNPDSSADVGAGNLSSASSEMEPSESAGPASSSSEIAAPSSSSESLEASSSADVMPASSSETSSPNSSLSSSSDVSSSSESVLYVLARDTAVTCEKGTYKKSACPQTTRSARLSCEGYMEKLGRDTTISEKILNAWEDGLVSCGAIMENVTVYGVISPTCYSTTMVEAPMFECSNGTSHYNDFVEEGNKLYLNQDEYNEAHGIFPEDLTQSCKQENFALFTDILADVQKALYERIVKNLEENTTLSEAKKDYLKTLIDAENKTLEGTFAPYFSGDHDYSYSFELKTASKNWFNGYIAKTKTCPDGTPETTDRYQKMYDAIYAECWNKINNDVAKIE